MVREIYHRPTTLQHHAVAVERTINYMRANLQEQLDLGRLATLVGLSKYHFLRVFTNVTGATPRHFITALRIDRAKHLLAMSSYSITDVCFEVGYSSVGSFSHTFGRLVGYTPTQFRGLPQDYPVALFRQQLALRLPKSVHFSGPCVEGRVAMPQKHRGILLLGAYETCVPEGRPVVGTILYRPGCFHLSRPQLKSYYILAAFIRMPRVSLSLNHRLDVPLVGSVWVDAAAARQGILPLLRMRPVVTTDPPLVTALPALFNL